MKENVVILIDDISSIKNDNEFEAIFDNLPEYRKVKISSYQNETDKRLSLLAGKLLKDGLAKLERPGLDDDVIVDVNGKPYIPGNPVYFSISHSGTKVMVVISNDEIGCDIQLIKPECLPLMDRYFTDDECSEIKNSENPVETFYQFWTIKESFLKANGKGLSYGLKNAHIKDGVINVDGCQSVSFKVGDDYFASYVITDNKINLIFDCDGTLVDSYLSICDHLQKTFRKFNVETDLEELRQLCIYSHVGICVETISNRFNLIPKAVFEEYKNDTDDINLITLYEGCKELISDPRFNCFVYTHRGQSTEKIFTKLGINNYFTEIVTSINGFQHKPHPEAVNYLVNKYELNKEKTYYIGDRLLDIECGNNAGIKTIFFNSSGLEIDSSKANFTVEKLLDIKEII